MSRRGRVVPVPVGDSEQGPPAEAPARDARARIRIVGGAAARSGPAQPEPSFKFGRATVTRTNSPAGPSATPSHSDGVATPSHCHTVTVWPHRFGAGTPARCHGVSVATGGGWPRGPGHGLGGGPAGRQNGRGGPGSRAQARAVPPGTRVSPETRSLRAPGRVQPPCTPYYRDSGSGGQFARRASGFHESESSAEAPSPCRCQRTRW